MAITARAPVSPSSAAHGERRAVSRPELLLLAAICILGGVLRFTGLGGQSFDFDESFTAGIVHGSLGHVFDAIPRTESSPPLYYVLAWLWTRVFGLGEVGLRSLSALVGAALVPVSYAVGRRLGSGRTGLVAGLLVAVNPLLVWYSQEARTYSLLALLSALSFWAFLDALERGRPRALALWAVACSAALASHYFAGFLVVVEAAWLLVALPWRRSLLVAVAAVAAVAAALVPLALRQADHRTEWIENLTLASRVKEVIKKWITGEIAPTHDWQLVLLAAATALALLLAARGLTPEARRGAALALGTATGALLVSFVVDIAGFHYLISKNEMPSMTVLLLGLGLILGGAATRGAMLAGLAGAAVLSAFFLFITVDGRLDPALQRADLRGVAAALGAPVAGQVVVTPRLGDVPLALYRPGAAAMPAVQMVSQVVVARPLPRADISRTRDPTPPAPSGFRLTGRRDAPTFTLICFTALRPRAVFRSALLTLAGGSGGPDAQVWPQAPAAAARPAPCGHS